MNRLRINRACLLTLSATVSFLAVLVFPSSAHTNPPAGPRFSISFPESASKERLDGRLLLLISTDNSKEPRLQISEDLSTQQVFGVDVDGLKPGQAATLDATAPGYPLGSLAQVPTGEYWVQALLHRYETFHRKDGHTVKLPMDRGEGQQWNRAPGNLYSTPRKIKITADTGEAIQLQLDQVIPPLAPPKDTKYVKHVSIQSKLLTDFWGRPMYLGAPALSSNSTKKAAPADQSQLSHFIVTSLSGPIEMFVSKTPSLLTK